MRFLQISSAGLRGIPQIVPRATNRPVPLEGPRRAPSQARSLPPSPATCARRLGPVPTPVPSSSPLAPAIFARHRSRSLASAFRPAWLVSMPAAGERHIDTPEPRTTSVAKMKGPHDTTGPRLTRPVKRTARRGGGCRHARGRSPAFRRCFIMPIQSNTTIHRARSVPPAPARSILQPPRATT